MMREGSSKSTEVPGSFEEQFAPKEKLMLPGGMADVVDISPESNPENKKPILLAPGWGSPMQTYKPAMRELFEKNRRVITLDHPRTGGDMSMAPQEAMDKYPSEEVRKAIDLLALLDAKGEKDVNIIAHSEAAINTVIAAVLDEENRIGRIGFYAPAGLIGEDTFTRLLTGFAGQLKRPESLSAAEGRAEIPMTDTERQILKDAALHALKYVAKNPLRALKEGLAISDQRSQIHEMLRYLHKKGVGIVVMAAVDDPIFPMDKMQDIAKTDMLDGFVSVRGGHGQLQAHPELYMTGMEELLTALEKKQEKERQERNESSA